MGRLRELRCQVGKTVHDFDAIRAVFWDPHGIQQIDRSVYRRDTGHHSENRRVTKDHDFQRDMALASWVRCSKRGLLEKSLDLAPCRQLDIKS